MSDPRSQLKRVFNLYPSYRDYIERTDDPKETLRAWTGILSKFAIADLVRVVDAICAGKIEVRKQYSKSDDLPWLIAEQCKRISDDRKRFAATDQIVKDSIGRKDQIEKHRYRYDLGKIYSQVRASAAKVKAGDKSQEEHDRFVDQLAAMARERE